MVRRGSLFDESKIIKKDQIPVETQEQQLEKMKSPTIVLNESEPTKQINENKLQEKIAKNDFPVFVVEQNKHTKTIETINIPKQLDVKVDIPKDQLQLININNNKCINELNLDLAILDSLLKVQCDKYDFYKNRFDYILLELSFLEKKKDIIKKLLEG